MLPPVLSLGILQDLTGKVGGRIHNHRVPVDACLLRVGTQAVHMVGVLLHRDRNCGEPCFLDARVNQILSDAFGTFPSQLQAVRRVAVPRAAAIEKDLHVSMFLQKGDQRLHGLLHFLGWRNSAESG